jgi:hypothetical protein
MRWILFAVVSAKKTSPFRIAGPASALEAFGEQLPTFARDDDLLRTRGAGTSLHATPASLSTG